MNDYKVLPCKRSNVHHLVMKHYLHKWPGVVVKIFGLVKEDWSEIIGTAVFALPPRETAKRYGVAKVWELARLYIIDETPKNTETWFVARSIKQIQRQNPDVELLVSYADPSANHTGTIYRAGNWISDGRTDQDRKSPRVDYAVGRSVYSRRSHVPAGAKIRRVPRVSKYRFVYWLANHEKKRMEAMK